MKVVDYKIRGFRDTLWKMRSMAREFSRDAAPLDGLSPAEAYAVVKRLPYVKDPEGLEFVSRPEYTLSGDWPGPRDCDDKSVILGAYAERNGIPWRLCAVGKGGFAHHVYPEFFLGGALWVPFDATFPDRGALGVRLYNERFRVIF